MEKRILVSCEGRGFIAVADSGGDGIEHVECEQHHPAFKLPTQVSLLGNILAGAKEIERLTSTDGLLAHIANQTGVSSEFFNRSWPYEQGKNCANILRSIPVRFGQCLGLGLSQCR
jgi:hypothetical protein